MHETQRQVGNSGLTTAAKDAIDNDDDQRQWLREIVAKRKEVEYRDQAILGP